MLKNISNISDSPTYHISNKHRNKTVDNTNHLGDNKEFGKLKNSQDTSNTDSYLVSISEEARSKAISKMMDAQEELARMESFADTMKQQIKQAQEQGKAEANAMKIRLNCMLIAARIMKGDEVPKEDIRYLKKNDMELYNKAILMRIQNDHPKKHKKISDNKEPHSPTEATDIAAIDVLQFGNGSINISAGTTMETSSTATNSETE
jgi:hypothetical protein